MPTAKIREGKVYCYTQVRRGAANVETNLRASKVKRKTARARE